MCHAKIPIFEQENTLLIFAKIAEAAANQAAVELNTPGSVLMLSLRSWTGFFLQKNRVESKQEDILNHQILILMQKSNSKYCSPLNRDLLWPNQTKITAWIKKTQVLREVPASTVCFGCMCCCATLCFNFLCFIY